METLNMLDGMNTPPILTRDEIFAEMEKRGIARLEVAFSGGGDEGGVDEFRAYDAHGEELVHVKLKEQCFYRRYINNEWVVEGDFADDDSLLGTSAAQPICDKYYGFAGDFQVHGTLVYDLASRGVFMEGEESQMVEFEVEIE